MMGEGFLLRTPLLGKDSRFAGYLLAATGSGNTAPYRQLFAAIGADKSPGGVCVIEDTGAPFDELTEEIPQGITVSLPRRVRAASESSSSIMSARAFVSTAA